MSGPDQFRVPSQFDKQKDPLSQPRVLLADDHRGMLEHVLFLLHASFNVVGIAANGRDLVFAALRLHPDVIVSDVTMPTLTGIEAAHELREAGLCSKFVFLTVHEEPEFVEACLDEGALGYVTKCRVRTDLIPAIKEALLGHRYISPSLPR